MILFLPRNALPILRNAEKKSRTIILVTHDPSAMERVADRAIAHPSISFGGDRRPSRGLADLPRIRLILQI